MTDESTNSPWMTRKEASEYLRLDISTIDKRLTPMATRPTEGKLRFETVRTGGKGNPPIRILAEDVYALLPPPPETAISQTNVVPLKQAS